MRKYTQLLTVFLTNNRTLLKTKMPVATSTLRQQFMSTNRGSICIEGNIGCGKTTLLEFFKNEYQDVYDEPVDCWRNVDGENLFQHLYADPKKFSLAFQTYVQLTMMKLHKKNPNLMERSIYSARYCFVENLYKLEFLSRVEYRILHRWFRYLVAEVEDGVDESEEFKLLREPKCINIDMIIYLRCSPMNAFDRVKARSRIEEKNITFEYLNNLHQLHEDWLVAEKCPLPAPVLILDTDCSIDSLKSLYQKAAPYIRGEKPLTKSPTIISLKGESP